LAVFVSCPRRKFRKLILRTFLDDSETGFVVECDLEYPSELHEAHNDYPLAPENVMVTEAMLSPFCKSMNVKHAFTEKLIGDQHPKIKYKTHYRPTQAQTCESPASIQTAPASVGVEKDFPERTSADPAERRIYRRHITVAHIGAGCYNQSAGQSDGKQ
jgi:hypothetical protein